MKKGLTDYRPEIEYYARGEGLDPNLVEAVVVHESIGGRADAFRYEEQFYTAYIKGKKKYAGMVARRIASSYGLMQVMPTTAEMYGFSVAIPEMLFEPSLNLKYGCRHLKEMLDWAKGDVAKALGAYNAGKPNALGERGRLYAGKVLKVLVQVEAAQRD